jgi:hypothetical protein
VTNNGVEPMVIALAEQLGTFVGRVRSKTDGWLENETLRQQVTQIRDGATQLLNHVNRAGAAVKKTVTKSMAVKKSKGKPTTRAVKGRSGGVVDAPGKRHRKPPLQELFDPRLGEPMGKQMGQKSVKNRMRSGRG